MAHVALDPALLIAKLHGEVPRYISFATSKHYSGLTAAARDKSLALPSKTKKKLIALDSAYQVSRHITTVSAEAYLQEVTAALGTIPLRQAPASVPSPTALAEVASSTAQPLPVEISTVPVDPPANGSAVDEQPPSVPPGLPLSHAEDHGLVDTASPIRVHSFQAGPAGLPMLARCDFVQAIDSDTDDSFPAYKKGSYGIVAGFYLRDGIWRIRVLWQSDRSTGDPLSLIEQFCRPAILSSIPDVIVKQLDEALLSRRFKFSHLSDTPD